MGRIMSVAFLVSGSLQSDSGEICQ